MNAVLKAMNRASALQYNVEHSICAALQHVAVVSMLVFTATCVTEMHHVPISSGEQKPNTINSSDEHVSSEKQPLISH